MQCKVADFGLTRQITNDDVNTPDVTDDVPNMVDSILSNGKIAIRWAAPEAIAFRLFSQVQKSIGFNYSSIQVYFHFCTQNKIMAQRGNERKI